MADLRSRGLLATLYCAALLQLFSVVQLAAPVFADDEEPAIVPRNGTLTQDEMEAVWEALESEFGETLLIIDNPGNFTASPANVGTAALSLQGKTKKKLQKKFLKLVNKARKTKGVPKICLNKALQKSSQVFADEMARKADIPRDGKGSDGSYPVSRAQHQGYQPIENCFVQINGYRYTSKSLWLLFQKSSAAMSVVTDPCLQHLGFARAKTAPDFPQYFSVVFGASVNGQGCN